MQGVNRSVCLNSARGGNKGLRNSLSAIDLFTCCGGTIAAEAILPNLFQIEEIDNVADRPIALMCRDQSNFRASSGSMMGMPSRIG